MKFQGSSSFYQEMGGVLGTAVKIKKKWQERD
jgi:hypothetical protein